MDASEKCYLLNSSITPATVIVMAANAIVAAIAIKPICVIRRAAVSSFGEPPNGGRK